MKPDNDCIQQVFELARQMIILADDGQAAATDDGCRLLFGVIQDCAYKIRLAAEREKEAHQEKGLWE